MNEAAEKTIGEIVEASVVSFTAEAPPDLLYQAPSFGSFVKAPDGEETIYAVVSSAETSSVEPNRRAAAFWQTEEELRKNQPQIFELLSTRFTALVIGHSDGRLLKFRLPPRPPRVHSFIYPCSSEEIRRLTGEWSIIRPLIDAPTGCSEDLVAAVLREGASHRENPRPFLVDAGKKLALLLRDDYPRLQAIIRKLA